MKRSIIILFLFLSAVVFTNYNFVFPSEGKPSSKISNKNSSCFQHTWNFILLDLVTNINNKELNNFVLEGNQKFLIQGKFPFKLGREMGHEVGGAMNRGIWFIKDDKYGNLVVKNICQVNSSYKKIKLKLALQEIKNAKVMHFLGFGPPAYIVEVRKNLYLITEEVPGMNLKEIAYNGFQLESTKSRIEKILLKSFNSTTRARAAYAKAILSNRMIINRLKEMAKWLDMLNYSSLDLQFMILPSFKGKEFRLFIIDGAQFKKVKGKVDRKMTATYLVNDYIKQLRKLASYY